MVSDVKLNEVIAAGRRLDPQYWARFIPATRAEMDHVERQLSISLPADFRDFYLTVGWGPFPDRYGGGLESPDEIVSWCSVPISLVTGSLTPGDEWATREEQEALWISKGKENPAPERFDDDVLDLDGVMLWDLLQVGSDGSCGYHNIYVGSATPPFRYCLIHEARILFRAPSFLDGMLLAIHQTAGTWAPTE